MKNKILDHSQFSFSAKHQNTKLKNKFVPYLTILLSQTLYLTIFLSPLQTHSSHFLMTLIYN